VVARQSTQAPSSTRRIALAGAALVALVLGLYAPVWQHEFVDYDDNVYVTENPFVQRGLTASSVAWAFTATRAANWHPLTWLSHMLDVEIYGRAPAGHHLTSVLLHAANALLLWLALRSMTGRFWPSLLVAALFAAHPLRVESVAWVAERKDVLAGLFFMAALLAYGVHARNPRPATYSMVLCSFALGLLAKPMVVTLPCLLLLLDLWPLRRLRNGRQTLRALVLEKVPLMALSAAAAVVTLVAQERGGAMRGGETWPLAARLANGAVAYVAYLWKTVWPAKLACFYPHPASTADGSLFPSALGAALLLAILTVLAFAGARRRPHLTVGWLWYLGTLVPVIGLVQVGSQAMADRYAYLPLIGIYIAGAWSLGELVCRRPGSRAIVVVAVAVALVALSVVTRLQIGHWKNGHALFEHAIRVTRHNYVAHNNLGGAYEAQGDLDNAARHFREALRIRADFPVAHNNLGLVLVREGDLTSAIERFERAIALDPAYAEAHSNLGTALERRGDLAGALEHLARALTLDPAQAEAHGNLGVVLERRGDLARAAAHYERALELDPDFAEAHSNLGNLLLGRGDLAEARRRYEAALRLRPEFAEGHNNLAFVLARSGNHREALTHYRRALSLRPALLPAASGLAWILATSADDAVRDGAEALTWAERCAQIAGTPHAACLEAWAAAYAELGDFERAVRLQTEAVARGPAAERDAPLGRLQLYRAGRPHRERPAS